LVGGLIILILL